MSTTVSTLSRPPAAADNPHRQRAAKVINRLPAFSPVLNKLIASMADENVSFAQLGDLVEKDTVLAGNVLRLVNSAAYSRRGTVNSVRHGVSILGLAKLRNAAMTWSLARMWNSQKFAAGWSSKEFNLHGLASAVVADLIAAESTVEYPEGGFAAGLLQNIGMLLEASALPEEYDQIRARYCEGTLSHLECEMEIIGVTHAELSAETLGVWNLPRPIVAAAAEHHTEPSLRSLGGIVAAADAIVSRQGIHVQSWFRMPHGTPVELLESIGLAAQANSILERFDLEFETMRGFFD
ncbi:MAG: HDOD domain-containing protein [Bryobacteraceae bacterium]